MKLLVTGADGFVGRFLVRAARRDGHEVVGAIMPGAVAPDEWQESSAGPAVSVIHADIRVEADLARIAAAGADAVVHLAAMASGNAARQDPQGAMQVNAVATNWLVYHLAETAKAARFLFVSSGEVYGPHHAGPIAETMEMNPVSPYAASKFAAEPAVLSMCERSAVQPIIARPFTHTGPGQAPLFVLPALAARLAEAKRTGAKTVKTGNLAPVRDFLDVRDVVRAYLLLLEHGASGEVYNVASGVGRSLADCFDQLATIIGVDATAEQDAALLRPDDIPVLIGDPTKLRQATGWAPSIAFEQTLQDIVDAQAH